MKPVIAAVAMLVLLTFTMLGVRGVSKCEMDKRAKAGNLEWHNLEKQLPSEASPTS
ncbi:hypothetical protein [Pontibacter cellulosilyticus]|uniref:Uncharacterized protein n=1 Tax=Pontibacter cellulosilyticus TaxID=1720253 RepID=A0A923N6W6_9BACT|nr:hypothetical protein [Pontibacter cellulosilyticus]MBC5992012.1 hypothetical protein [Pontibacter cellulosilyticus]